MGAARGGTRQLWRGRAAGRLSGERQETVFCVFARLVALIRRNCVVAPLDDELRQLQALGVVAAAVPKREARR